MGLTERQQRAIGTAHWVLARDTRDTGAPMDVRLGRALEALQMITAAFPQDLPPLPETGERPRLRGTGEGE